MFSKFAKQYLANNRQGIKKRDIQDLVNVEVTTFHHLEYFGLITRYGEEQGNEWHLSKDGEQFFAGQEPVFDLIAHMDGEILPLNHECWDTNKDKPKLTMIWEIMKQSQREWEEYTHYKEIRKSSFQKKLF